MKRKWHILMGSILLVCMAAGLAVWLLPRPAPATELPALYVKQGDLYCLPAGQTQPLQLTAGDEQDAYHSNDPFLPDLSLREAHITLCGTRLFFPVTCNADGDRITLAYRDLNSRSRTVIVDSDVTDYRTDAAGRCILYRKGGSGGLYRYTGKEPERIARQTLAWYASPDLKQVLYQAGTGLYLWEQGEEAPHLLEENVGELLGAASDLSRIYYRKNDFDLYCRTPEQTVCVSEDISLFLRAYETGEAYYVQGDGTALYCFDGAQEIRLVSDIVSPWAIDFAPHAPAALLEAHAPDGGQTYIYAVSSTRAIRMEEPTPYASKRFSPDGTRFSQLNVLDDIMLTGQLYLLDAEDHQAAPALLLEDVLSWGYGFLPDNTLLSMKNYRRVPCEMGDLYRDGVLVDYNIPLYQPVAPLSTGEIVYFSNWIGRTGCGILKRSGDPPTELAEQVRAFVIGQADEIFFCSPEGQLYRWADDAPQLLDTDVEALLFTPASVDPDRPFA